MFSNSIILPTSKWNFSKNADLVVMLNTRKGQILEIFNYYKYNLQVIVIIESPQTNLNIKCVFVTQPLNPTEPDPVYKKTGRPAMHSIWKWPLMRFYVYTFINPLPFAIFPLQKLPKLRVDLREGARVSSHLCKWTACIWTVIAANYIGVRFLPPWKIAVDSSSCSKLM